MNWELEETSADSESPLGSDHELPCFNDSETSQLDVTISSPESVGWVFRANLLVPSILKWVAVGGSR